MNKILLIVVLMVVCYQNPQSIYESGVTTYDGTEQLGAVYAAWNNPGVDPKAAARRSVSTAFDLQAGETKTLADITGAGTICSIVLSEVGSTRIQMYWDGEDVPSVDAPTEYLFVGESLMMGANYNYFPMPFHQRATILLTASEPVSGRATVRFSDRTYADAGYFTAVHNKEYTTTGLDYTLLDLEGRGHVVGTVLRISGFEDYGILEGDDRVYIDGELRIHGTGMEDLFNGGWYFNRGAFALPVHGALRGWERVVAYRLHIADAIPFERSIRYTIEHGGQNEMNADFESVVFAYVR